MFAYLLTILVAALSVVSSPVELVELEKRQSSTPAAFSNFAQRGVYYPPSTYPLWRAAYAHTIQANDSSLIMTWENYPSNEPDWFPIIQSTDGGVTWSNLSKIVDTQNGWGMRFQPNLYVLPQAFGGFPAGSIIATGVSTPVNLQGPVWIDMYASTDNGKSWTFVSHIIYSNGQESEGKGSAIWEPWTMIYNGKFIIYYSDERDSAHSQKISYATSTDLKNWSVSQDVVAYSAQGDRPGMPTLAYLPNSAQWIMTYEYCGGGGCRVHYRLSKDPLSWTNAPDWQLVTSNNQPTSSPRVIYYRPPGATQGTILVSDAYTTGVYINDENANSTTWKLVDSGQYAGYSRSLTPFKTPSNTWKLHYSTGGYYGCQGSCYNYVANGVGDIPSYYS